MTKKTKENLNFQAEVSKLLHLVANSLYSEREIFLRELISNSADACEKLRYQSLSKKNLLENDKDLKINIRVSKKRKIIEVEDNGIGMSRQDLIENLGTIARSGTSKFIEAMKNKKEADISAIGQFGVGFYSSYMVADSVEASSKDAEKKEANLWISNGKESYSIEKINKDKRGTSITLHVKKDSGEFLDAFRLRSIITKYSNYIPFPIYLKDLDSKEKEEKINEGNPLWLKDKKDIKVEDYKQFYNNISFNFDEPLKIVHYNAEGVINYKALLYVPTNQPMDLFHSDRKNKIKLYVQKVFITDECDEIIPSWLRFIPGVVDSQDISLNISREMLQNNPVIEKIKKGITNKILNEFSITSKQTICLIVLGRHRDQLGLVSLKENAEIYKFEIEFMGELNTEEISHHLQRSDLGVSTTPFDVLGKSGTSAAMLEHGLPLLTYDDGDTQFEQLFVFEPFKEQVLLLNDPNWTEKMANRLAVRKRSSFFNGVAQTADNLLEAII